MVAVQVHLIASTQKEDIAVLHQLASSLHYFFKLPGSHVGCGNQLGGVWFKRRTFILQKQNLWKFLLKAFPWNFAPSKNPCYTVVTSVNIAKCLGVRLLILQCVFSVGGVWPRLLSHLGMQLKLWFVCEHPSRLGIQLKDPVYKVVYTYVSLLFPVLSWCLWFHSCNIKMAENCDESDKEIARRLMWNGSKDREPNCSHYPVKSAARLISTRAKKAQGHLEKRPYL